MFWGLLKVIGVVGLVVVAIVLIVREEIAEEYQSGIAPSKPTKKKSFNNHDTYKYSDTLSDTAMIISSMN